MSLIKCPECGHQVSDTAASCPGCGAPLTKPKKKAFTVSRPLGILLQLIGLVLIFSAYVASQSNNVEGAITYGVTALVLIIWGSRTKNRVT